VTSVRGSEADEGTAGMAGILHVECRESS
jgi:hypothetical protein